MFLLHLSHHRDNFHIPPRLFDLLANAVKLHELRNQKLLMNSLFCSFDCCDRIWKLNLQYFFSLFSKINISKQNIEADELYFDADWHWWNGIGFILDAFEYFYLTFWLQTCIFSELLQYSGFSRTFFFFDCIIAVCWYKNYWLYFCIDYLNWNPLGFPFFLNNCLAFLDYSFIYKEKSD